MTGVTQRAVHGLATVAVVAGISLVPAAPGLSGAHAASPAERVEVYPVPPGGVFTFHGRGFGHGHGLSQWGAYGAAKVDHLSANQILHFYYPHTTLATRSTERSVRVLITAADAPSRGYLQVNPAPGLTVTPASDKAVVLPVKNAQQQPITSWRLRRQGSTIQLREQVGGSWTAVTSVGNSATFTDTAAEVPVVEPSGVVTYRGDMVAELESGSLDAVNDVNLELYIDSVVPAEMPSSWSAAALQSQAVAARTYASRGINSPKASFFDVFGDTRDQAYGGVGRETARTTKAVAATAGEIVVDAQRHAVLAQYASANGGWTVSGGVSYLPAKRDPYDGAVPNNAHAWTTSVAAASLSSAYPQVGSLQSLQITGRDGNGIWGGRVTALKLVGTKGTATLSGTDLQFALGLRSPWFRPVPPPGMPTSLKATASGSTVTATWQAPAAVPGSAPVTGYLFTLTPGKHKQTLDPATLTASVAQLPAGAHTVSVRALSKAGAGPPVTMVVQTVNK